ncbi:MAG: HAD family hydrolase [Planctomycetota bacterium]
MGSITSPSPGHALETSGGGGWLLISDVDDTLTGDDAALRELVGAVARRRPRLTFALNSSRPAASVDRTLAEVFPTGFTPDAVITAMGTQMRIGGAWDDAWTARFADWPRDEVFDVVSSLGFRGHDAEYQTPHKASFAVPAGEAQAEVLRELDKRGLPVRAIASGADDLDLLPPSGGKDHATLYLAERLGFHETQRWAVAGDSANDLAMFRVAPHAIAVGNARAELLDAMPRDTAWHADEPHAAGVHAGLRRLGVWVD